MFTCLEAPPRRIVAITLIVIAVAMALADAGRGPVGGFTDERIISPINATPEDLDAISVFNASRPLIEERIGQRLGASKLVSYRVQVVAGMRFLMRVQTAQQTPEFIHASVWRRLTGDIVLGKVETHKMESDTLELAAAAFTEK